MRERGNSLLKQLPGVNGAGSGAGAQVHGQAAQVPGVNGAGSKTGAEPAPRIGLLRCSGGASFGPKMEPAPFTLGTCAIGVLVGFVATPQPMYVQKIGNPVRWRCTYIGSRGAYHADNQRI